MLSKSIRRSISFVKARQMSAWSACHGQYFCVLRLILSFSQAAREACSVSIDKGRERNSHAYRTAEAGFKEKEI